MKRGVILEIDSRFLTLLTPDGEFLRSRKVKDQYEIGEEIDFFPVNEYVKEKKSIFRFNKLRAGIASTMAAALLFFSIFTLNDGNEVYAYMTIDINPSIEAGVDKKLRVVSLEAYNSEGEEVVNNLEEWLNEPIDSVTEAIIQESKDSGYYKEGAEVLLTTVIVEEDKDEPVAKELTESVQTIVEASKEEDVIVTAVNSTPEDRKNAIKQGISTGKYVKEKLTVQEKKEQKQKENEFKAVEKNAPGEKGINNGNGNDNDNGEKNQNQGKDKQLFDKKGDTNPPAVEKNKENINIDGNQSNKGKGNQEDKKGPPEAVQKGKNKEKKQNNNKNKNE